MMRPVIVIPSRLESTRLPQKPLADIGGRAMIARVAECAMRYREKAPSPLPVILAAGHQAIIEAVSGIEGLDTILTQPDLPSGSDRVQAALRQYDPENRYDTVINLQGDLPFITVAHIERVLLPLADPHVDIATLVAPINNAEDCDASSVVKVACAFAAEQDVARALYFSRQTIPWGVGSLWHHIGIYAWRRSALARFVELPPSLLEQREKLEQLRALEAGMVIGCSAVADAPLGVDVEADLLRAREYFAAGAYSRVHL